MKFIGWLWGAAVILAPFAMVSFAIMGIWGDTRWAITALILLVAWFPNAMLAAWFLTRPNESVDLDVPDWMKNN